MNTDGPRAPTVESPPPAGQPIAGKRSRRSLIAGSVGAAVVYVTSALGRAPAVSATHQPEDVALGVDNVATSQRTLLHNSHANVSASSNDYLVDALFGYAQNNGAGVAGQSTGGGVGVKGYSGPIPMPNTLDYNVGVFGEAASPGGNNVGVLGVTDHQFSSGTGVVGLVTDEFTQSNDYTIPDDTGVYGFGGIAFNATGVVGDSSYGTGVRGHSSYGQAVRGLVDGSGTAVYGSAPTAGLALRADGRVKFSRSGIASIAAGATSVSVVLDGVTTSSMVFAVVAKNVAARWVRAVVPSTGSFRIYVNKALVSSAPVSWFVLD